MATRDTITALARALDLADVARHARHMVLREGETMLADGEILVRIATVLDLRDAVLDPDVTRDDLRALAIDFGEPRAPEDLSDDEQREAITRIVDSTGTYREHSCALALVDAVMRDPSAVGPCDPWPADQPVQTVVERARMLTHSNRSLSEALDLCRAQVVEATGPKLPPGWERNEDSMHGRTWVHWQRGGEDGPDLDFELDDGKPKLDTLDVCPSVTLAELGAIMTFESRRGGLS